MAVEIKARRRPFQLRQRLDLKSNASLRYLAESTDAHPKESKIALRAKQGAVSRFDCVRRTGYVGKYQDRIIAVDVGTTPAIFKLNNQPVCELVDMVNERVRFSLDTYRLRQGNIELNSVSGV